MTIITSQPPYRDDFDKSKGYYRVLYKPGYPVQARELTQQQTALQYQIEKFGRHIFDEGSLVTGGQFDIDLNFPYVLLLPENSAGNYTNPLSFKGKTLQGSTSGVKAKVIWVEEIVQDGVVYYPAMIRYVSGSATTNDVLFAPGENAFDEDSPITTIKIRPETFGAVPVLGTGSLFNIQEGVVFSNGFFIDFSKQSIILSAFSRTPTCKIGFSINHQIVSETDDESLLDPSNGTPNYNAPGADRLKIEATLTKIALDDVTALSTFVELFTIKDGVVQTRYDRPQYAIIGDEIAKRTYDESGDYTIRGHGIRTREHLDTGVNEGYLTSAQGGDSTLLSIDVEPGLSYVKGYEVETLVTQHISTPKSMTFEYINSQVVSARSSNYIIIEEIVGIPALDRGTQIQLYCSGGPDIGEKRVTNIIPSTTAPTGQLIGTARVKSVAYESGTLGTASGRLRIYLYDIRMNGQCGGIPNLRSIYCSSPVHFFADVVLNSVTGLAELQQRYTETLLYSIGTNFTRTIRSDNDLSDTTFTFQRTNENISIGADGTIDVSVITTGEQFAYGEGSLSPTEKLNIFVTLTEAAQITLPGKVSGSGTTLTQYNANTTYFTHLNVGDKIEISGVAGTYIVKTISSNTSLTVDRSFATGFTDKTFEKVYSVGDFIDLNSKGCNAGITRTVAVDSPRKSLSIDLKETFGDTISATVSFLVTRTSALEIKKLLYTNRFVKINCSSLGTPLTGPINLGISDVFKIRQIRKSSIAFTSSTQGSEVTDEFIFDNGQRDDFYDHAKIQLKPGFSLSATDYLLVELDFFEPDFTQGVGYFSVDSYPIDDTKITSTTIFTHEIPVYKSPETGKIYNLRDYLDYRSVKLNTADNSSTVIGASTNPGMSGEFKKSASGLRLAFPSSSIYIDYSYYLARRDVVIANTNKAFSVIQGTPAIFPVTPQVPESVMGLAELYIPPYPSISGSYGRILGRTDISVQSKKTTFERHTMRDIGVLKERINNLEYYTTLSLLEKNVKDMMIPDENGLDRFKNGYFVDNFEDHSLGATYNNDYRISVDGREQCIRPYFDVDSFKYQYLPNQSSNVKITKSMITLPYTEVPFIEQLKATSYRNIEQSVFRYIGNITLDPDTDIWVDSSTVDKTIQQDFSFDGTSIFGTTWGSWSEYVTGYNVYQQAGNWTGLKFVDGTLNETAVYKGSFTSLQQAQEAALQYAQYGYDGRHNTQRAYSNGAVETLSTVSRQGIKTSGTTKTSVNELGSFVTDVSLATYIRPQTILVYAKGLKAHTRFHVFFDEENMNDYVIPYPIADNWDGDLDNFTFPSYNTRRLNAIAIGGALKTDAYGDLVFHLILPATGKRFRIGTKEIKVTDSPTNAEDATSYAVGYFVSHGLIQQKQNTILSTKHTVVQTETLTESRTKQSVKVVGPSCMAYSFFVRAEEPGTKQVQDGVFLTSVDVWIQSVDTANKLGVWFEIREMNPAGGITRTQVPYSEVWMKWNDPRIKTSNDASKYTRVNFSNPVFLMHDTQYAFIIHTEGLNPNTYFFVSRIGENDLVTGQQVTSRQLTGNVYTTNNNLNWDIVPDIDLKVRFNRAKFQKGTGEALFGNESNEFFIVKNKSNVFTQYGEKIRGSDKLTLSNIVGTDVIEVGDVLTGATSGTIATVLSISGNSYFTNNIGFTTSETISVKRGSPLSLKNVSATISTIEYGLGTLVSFNRRNNKMILSQSNGKFFPGSEIQGMNSAVTAIIDENERLFLYDFSERGVLKVGDSITGLTSGQTAEILAISGSVFTVDGTGFMAGESIVGYDSSPDISAKILRISNGIEDFYYSTVQFNPNNIVFTNTDIRYNLREVVTSSDTLGQPKNVLARTDVFFDTQRSLLSKTNEILRLAGSKSAQASCIMTTTSELVSPIIDMNRTSGVYVYNIVNDDIIGEDNPSGGNLFNKYISKIVTLAENQDAEDLLVSLSAYVPPGITDDYPIKVWAKILNNQDGELFSEKNWIEMERVGDSPIYSSGKNINDYKAIDYTFPASMISTDEIKPGVQYTSNGNVYTGFKQFAVKIGLLGNEGDTAIVPKVADLKVIALQM